MTTTNSTSPFKLRSLAGLLIAASVLTAGCQSSRTSTSQDQAATTESAPRLFAGLGNHTRQVSTSNPQAQKFFDQGLTWAYAFNHDEAIRSFSEAARLDPNCAMAWWGVALCHGPHINNPIMPPERRTAAMEAIAKAQAPGRNSTVVERALIDALAARYSADLTGDRAPLDQAYADAMVKVQKAYPQDADIATLTAESLMDLQPWDLWNSDGSPKGRTMEILALLEEAMRLDGDNPGSLHLYIHASEASSYASKAVPAADKLRTLVPAAGHLVHMPSHIDVRVGRWDQAADANVRAAAADAAYRKLSPRQGFYHVYMAHNNHFLAFAAMNEGRFAVADQAARNMIAGVPPEFIEHTAPLIDPYMSIEDQVLMRFGKWDQILAKAKPDSRLPITTAHWHFARGSALAAKGDIAGAEREQGEFRKAAAAVPADAMMAINKAHDVLEIAERVLAGEIAYRKGRTDEAISSLQQAVEREDRLRYMEPPEWIQPARHSLGAILLDADRPAEAEKVYRDDLVKWPENGWSLFGLASALKAQGHNDQASDVNLRFRKVWTRADTKIHASCLCIEK